MLPNADHLSDLSLEDRDLLLKYIKENFKMVKSVNKKRTAYGLKARFNRLTGADKKHHITSQCFMEAMVESGYKAASVPDLSEPDWYFNIGKTHFTD